MTGIDCSAKLTAQAAAMLKAEGYDFAGRYLVPDSGSLAWKALTHQEAQIISDAGLKLLCVWETAADRMAQGAAAGVSDGAAMYKLAKALDIPTSAILYFACDYEATDMAPLEAYLRAARGQTGDYEVGVYGSYRVVEAMAAREACRGFWQCMAWSYGQVSQHLTVYQHTAETVAAGIRVDLNNCPDPVKAGLWDYQEEEPEMTEAEVREIAGEVAQAVCQKLLVGADSTASPWAKQELAEAAALGITDGTRPQGYAKREEVALMCKRAVAAAVKAAGEPGQ